MNLGYLHLLAACLVLILDVDGHNITCTAPVVRRGQPASVTCHFGRDIRPERKDFKIHKYDLHGTRRAVAISCYWNGDIPKPSCLILPGYDFNHQVDDNATLQILNATEDSVGTYVCQVTPAVEGDVLKPCFLAVKDSTEPVITNSSTHRQPNEEDGSNPLLPALVTVVVLSVGAVVALVAALVITRKRYAVTKDVEPSETHPPSSQRLLERKRAIPDNEEHLPLLEIADSTPQVLAKTEISGSGRKALLLDACRANQVQMAMWLIESGASVNGRDKVNGDTPLHVACRCGHETIFKVLLYTGADIEAQNGKGFTPLHKACKYGRTTLVNMLIDAGAFINAYGRNYITPLQLALKNDNTEVIAVLLRAGARHDDEDIKIMPVLEF